MGFTMILFLGYLILFIIDIFALTLGLIQKKWILFEVISSIIVISIIILGYLLIKLPDENIQPIIFERESNGEYAYIIYEGREYVPYCAISPRERDCYLGYVGEDEQDKIYTLKNYSEEEWLISYLDSGMMNDCMLLKEKNVKNIPDGLSSEYDWNKNINNQNITNTTSENTTISENNIDISISNKQTNQNEIKEENNSKVENIKIKVNNETLNVKLEENSATEALVQKLKQGDITVNTHEYGGFEQVGSLGFSLPIEDTQITTKSGDLMLYQGNQITLFYGSNSWSYTKLGEVINKSNNELKNILGNGDVTLVLSIN